MPDTWVYGLDASDEEITVAEFGELLKLGLQVFVQCLWTANRQPAVRVINLRNAMTAGVPAIAGYISLNNQHEGNWHVDRGREGMPDDIWAQLRRVPIDVEDIGIYTPAYQHVLQAGPQIRQHGKPWDIYTNWHTWSELLGNPPAPHECGLWNAYWDADPDIDFPKLPFGGWSIDEVIGEQWQGQVQVGGQAVDRNQFRASAFGLQLPPATPAPAPTPPATPKPKDLVAGYHRDIARAHLNIAGLLDAQP